MTTIATKAVRKLGAAGPEVFPIALGCMGMSGMYGSADEAESLATIHAAMDAGVNLIDTGDFYGMGHNEMLVGRALYVERDQVLISVKFGAQRGPDGSWLGYDARPVAVKTALAYSLKRLGTDYIDIYRPARLDPNVPIEDTVGAIADMIKAGYVRYIGLSEVGPGDDPPRRSGASHRRSADRVLARQPRSGSEDLPGSARAWHRRDRVWSAVARPAVRLAHHRAGRSARPTFRASRARTAPATSAWSSNSARSPRTKASARCNWLSHGCSRRATSSSR